VGGKWVEPQLEFSWAASVRGELNLNRWPQRASKFLVDLFVASRRARTLSLSLSARPVCHRLQRGNYVCALRRSTFTEARVEYHFIPTANQTLLVLGAET